MNFKYKKSLTTGMAVALAAFIFLANASSARAAGCGENQKQSYFLSVFNPLISFAEKAIKGFGYDIVLAAAPDPDQCGTCLSSDSVGCSGSTPTATMNWEAALPGPWGFNYYILTVSGVGTFNTGFANFYTVSSGLANNTTYDWSVEVYSYDQSSASLGYTNQPCGSFTTLNCTPVIVIPSPPTGLNAACPAP